MCSLLEDVSGLFSATQGCLGNWTRGRWWGWGLTLLSGFGHDDDDGMKTWTVVYGLFFCN
jgi:hypothetical protein